METKKKKRSVTKADRKKIDLLWLRFIREYCTAHKCHARCENRRVLCFRPKCFADYLLKIGAVKFGGEGIDDEWVHDNICVKAYEKEHDRMLLNHDERRVISWANHKLHSKLKGSQK